MMHRVLVRVLSCRGGIGSDTVRPSAMELTMTSKWISNLAIVLAFGATGCKEDVAGTGTGTDTDTDGMSAGTAGTLTTEATLTAGMTEGTLTTTSPTVTSVSASSAEEDGSASSTASDGEDDGDTEDEDGDTVGDSETTEGDDTEGQSTGAQLDDIIEVLCEWEFNCCSAGELDYRLGPFTTDVDDCVARYTEQVNSNDDILPMATPSGLLTTLAYGVRLDRSVPNDDAIEACLESLRGNECNAVIMDGGETPACEPGGSAVAPCDLGAMFSGTQRQGEPCTERWAAFDIECEEGTTCESFDGNFVCVDKGLEGEFCEGDDDACVQDLYCNDEGRCAPRADVGETCTFEDPDDPQVGTETLPCKAGLTCTPPDAGSNADGTCAESCTSGFDCIADVQCPEGLSCIPVRIGTVDIDLDYCLPQGTDESASCDSDGDCAEGLYCDGDFCAERLTIAEAGQDGECETDSACPEGYWCWHVYFTYCDLARQAGESCDPDDPGDSRCPEDTLGCIETSDDIDDSETICATELLAIDVLCTPGANATSPTGNFCRSGVCESVEDVPRCVAGLALNDACSPDDANADAADLCAVGLYCDDDDDGVCRRRLGSGEICDPEVALQCLNGTCVEAWNGDFFCTDQPGSPDEATCDGDV